MPRDDKEGLLSSESDQSDGIVIENELAGQVSDFSVGDHPPDTSGFANRNTSQTVDTAVTVDDSAESVQSGSLRSDVLKSMATDDSVGAITVERLTPKEVGWVKCEEDGATQSNDIIEELPRKSISDSGNSNHSNSNHSNHGNHSNNNHSNSLGIRTRMSRESGDQYKPLEGDEETEIEMSEEEAISEILTVEDMVNRSIGANNSKASLCKFIALFLVGVLAKIAGPALAYDPIFTGFLNYKDWECISERCVELMANFTDKPDKFFSRETICGNSLEPNEDFKWTIERTSYALEWGLICSNEDKVSNLKSFFFIGAFIGLILGTALFDKIGRRTTSLIGIAITSLSSLAINFVNSYDIMLPLRVVQGIGSFIAVTGVDLLSIEFTPSNLRNLSQILSSSAWDLGSIFIIGVSYGVKNWHHIYLVQGCVLAATAIAVFIYPESPRFQLVKGREKEARATFKKISKVFKTKEISEKAELTYKDYDKNYLGQIKDFKKYPLLMKNAVILMVCWMMIACVSYGLVFSWGKLGADIYTSILFATLGDFIAKGSGVNYYIIHFFGRRKAVMINFAGLAAVFFLAIPSHGVHLTGTWNLDQMVCLFASSFIGGVWGSVSLLTKELFPTSHRGMIFCMCSATARIGAFVGPYLTLLYNSMDPRIVQSIFGSIAAFSSFLAYFNSDSTHKPIPSTPEDMVHLHSDTGHEKLQDHEVGPISII